MGLHKSKAITGREMDLLSHLMKTIDDVNDYKRVQSLYLRGPLSEGAWVSNWESRGNHAVLVGSYKKIWTLYFKGGVEALKIKPRGGRNHYNLTPAEEKALLERYTTVGENGTMLNIGPLYEGYCEKVGRKVDVSSAYRLAQRHGWRKIAPRPEHPGRNPKAAESFKVFFSSPD